MQKKTKLAILPKNKMHSIKEIILSLSIYKIFNQISLKIKVKYILNNNKNNNNKFKMDTKIVKVAENRQINLIKNTYNQPSKVLAIKVPVTFLN